MSDLTASSPVVERIMHALRERLRVINGSGCFWHDVANDIHYGRPSEDLDLSTGAAIYISRLQGSETRNHVPSDPAAESYEREIVIDVLGVVAEAGEPFIAGEHMLADLERALELDTDRYLRDPDLDINLLSDQLILTSADVDQLPGTRYEIAAVGVRCTWPHQYGDPSHVKA